MGRGYLLTSLCLAVDPKFSLFQTRAIIKIMKTEDDNRVANRRVEGVRADHLAQRNSEYYVSVTERVMLVCCFQQALWHLLFILRVISSPSAESG